MVSSIRDLFHQPFFTCLLALVACACYYYLNNEKNANRKIVWTFYSFIFGLMLFIFIANAIYRIYHPQLWDFTCFYIYGKVAAGGQNFYLPENLHVVFNSLNVPLPGTEDFFNEVLNVGFPYPPPTILYFAPMGYLSYNIALTFWTVFNLFFVAGCIYLIYTLFFKSYRLNGLLLVSILFFTFLPSLQTISLSQTNFILLFCLLLIKKYPDKKFTGFVLAVSFFTKPYMLIFILFFLVRKKWNVILYFILSSIVIIGLTMILFGRKPFVSYLFNNFSSRLPAWAFSERANQSLPAVLLRNHFITIDKPIQYIYIVTGILLLTGFLLLYLLKKRLYDIIWAILLLVGLLIYPGTLGHYAVLLLFIIFQFFDSKNQLGFKLYLNIIVIAIFYYLAAFSAFSSICFLLVITVLKSFNLFQIIKPAPQKS